MRKVVNIIIFIASVAAIIYTAQRTKDGAAMPATPQPAKSERRSTSSERKTKPFEFFVTTDTENPEFTQRVQPIISKFFATLDRAGVNPIKGSLRVNKVQIHHGPNGMSCRFLIGDGWASAVYVGRNFSGVMYFGERGPDDPFGAISDVNTNALNRLSERAISMAPAEAERIVNHIADTFGIDRSGLEKPEIYPEKMFDYDLGIYTAAYRKKGSDPVNGMNYPLTFSIRATSPTTAVLVMYSHSGKVKLGL